MMPNETQASSAGHGGARDFLAVLFRRRWIIATVFAVTTLTVLAINLTRPLFFESTGKVILKRGEKDTLLGGGLRTMTWEEELASEVETVKSDAIVSRAQAIVDEAHKKAGTKKLRIDGRHVDAEVDREVERARHVVREPGSRGGAGSDRRADPGLHGVPQLGLHAAVPEGVLRHRARPRRQGARRVDAPPRGSTCARRRPSTSTCRASRTSDFVRTQKLELAKGRPGPGEKARRAQSMKSLLAGADRRRGPAVPRRGPITARQRDHRAQKKLSDARTRLHSMEAIYVPDSRELTQQRARGREPDEGAERRGLEPPARPAGRGLESRGRGRAEVLRAMGEGQGRLGTYPERAARILEYTTRIEALQRTSRTCRGRRARPRSPRRRRPIGRSPC
jgi:hypothetical protein